MPLEHLYRSLIGCFTGKQGKVEVNMGAQGLHPISMIAATRHSAHFMLGTLAVCLSGRQTYCVRREGQVL